MNIKHILLTLLASAALLTSCDKAENEYHSTYFYPIGTNGIIAYADGLTSFGNKITDTVTVCSYDTWTMNQTLDWFDVYYGNTANSFTITIPAGYMASTDLRLAFQPNTTGAQRTGSLAVTSSASEIGVISIPVYQQSYLYVDAVLTKTTSTTDTPYYYYTKQLPQPETNAEVVQSKLSFRVAGTDATLSTDNTDWLTLSQTTDFKAKEVQTVTLTALRNTTGVARTGKITLQSAGVSTDIHVVQPAQSE